MASHRAMKALAESPEAVRAMARSLLTLGCTRRSPAKLDDEGPGAGGGPAGIAWSDWELDFLESMAGRDSGEPLTLRQREVLSDLENAARRHATIDGLSVRLLIGRAYLERQELEEESDQEFIEGLRASGSSSVTGRQSRRLLACCRKLGIIEPHHGAAY